MMYKVVDFTGCYVHGVRIYLEEPYLKLEIVVDQHIDHYVHSIQHNCCVLIKEDPKDNSYSRCNRSASTAKAYSQGLEETHPC